MAVSKTLPHRGVFLTRVLDNVSLCREHYRVVLEVEDFPPAAPGQFVQILCGDPASHGWTGTAFIRRPFSIAGLRRSGTRCEMDILHRVIGPGTRWLAGLKPGDSVNILGPLGQPFPIDERIPKAFLVGGGVGLPPLIWLAEALQRAGRDTLAFCGARSGDLLPLTRADGSSDFSEFAQFGVPTVIATDDGSLGARGRIPEVFADYLKTHAGAAQSAIVYTCGPEPMMHAVAQLCRENQIPCQVCLERVMACGMGTCQSCVVAVHDDQAEHGWRYRLCCTDGPVFNSEVVIWS